MPTGNPRVHFNFDFQRPAAKQVLDATLSEDGVYRVMPDRQEMRDDFITFAEKTFFKLVHAQMDEITRKYFYGWDPGKEE